LPTNRTRTHTILRLVCLVLILSVLTVTLIREISRLSDDYSFEVATLTDYTVTDTFTGYVFRDEVALSSTNNGPVHYLADEGATVSAGTERAEVFRDDTGTDKRERAAVLYAEIAALQAALKQQTDWKSAYLADYPSLMQTLGTGNYQDAAAKAQQLTATLGGRAATQTAEALRVQIAALRSELDALVKHTNDPAPVPATTDGIFHRTADGYEQAFTTKAAAELTPEKLSALLTAPASNEEYIGKLIGTGTWFLAIPTTKAIAQTYTAGDTYTLHLGSASLSMTLDRITPAESSEDVLLLFCADSIPAALSLARAHQVRVEKQTVTGLSIPACALTAENAVFVIRDGVARLCPVVPLQAKDGCVLATPDEKGGLREGDRVIVSARQIYDGKVLE